MTDKITLKFDADGLIRTVINHGGGCCGCLNGKLDGSSISFACNECGEEAGYIKVTTE